MSKKKTPPEKKQAAYEKDHFTFARNSAKSLRKNWKKTKNYKNRVVRRKSKNLLHAVEGVSLNELGPIEESFTAEVFRKGLSRKKVRKTGVVRLREKVQIKKDRREARRESRREQEERASASYTEGIVALERDPDGEIARKLIDSLRFSNFHLWTFLRDHPDWEVRLRTRVNQLQKQQELIERKAKLKQKEKWKWRSPVLRLPKQ